MAVPAVVSTLALELYLPLPSTFLSKLTPLTSPGPVQAATTYNAASNLAQPPPTPPPVTLEPKSSPKPSPRRAHPMHGVAGRATAHQKTNHLTSTAKSATTALDSSAGPYVKSLTTTSSKPSSESLIVCTVPPMRRFPNTICRRWIMHKGRQVMRSSSAMRAIAQLERGSLSIMSGL